MVSNIKHIRYISVGSKNNKIGTDKRAKTKTLAPASRPVTPSCFKDEALQKSCQLHTLWGWQWQSGDKNSQQGRQCSPPASDLLLDCDMWSWGNKEHVTHHKSYWTSFILTKLMPSVLTSAVLKSFCWYLTCQWCSRWAGWRFRGALTAEGAFRTNQAVFTASVTNLDAVCSNRARKLSAICSP